MLDNCRIIMSTTFWQSLSGRLPEPSWRQLPRPSRRLPCLLDGDFLGPLGGDFLGPLGGDFLGLLACGASCFVGRSLRRSLRRFLRRFLRRSLATRCASNLAPRSILKAMNTNNPVISTPKSPIDTVESAVCHSPPPSAIQDRTTSASSAMEMAAVIQHNKAATSFWKPGLSTRGTSSLCGFLPPPAPFAPPSSRRSRSAPPASSASSLTPAEGSLQALVFSHLNSPLLVMWSHGPPRAVGRERLVGRGSPVAKDDFVVMPLDACTSGNTLPLHHEFAAAPISVVQPDAGESH